VSAPHPLSPCLISLFASSQSSHAQIERLPSEEVLGSPFASTWVKDDWLVQAESRNGEAHSTWPFWTHRILLSNGWELTLYFHDVAIDEYENLLTPPTTCGTLTASESASTSA
jgi:hypothetical protein